MSVPDQKQASGHKGSMAALPSTADKHQGDGYVSFVPGAKVPLYSITSPARRDLVCGVLNPGTPSRPLTVLHAEWLSGNCASLPPAHFAADGRRRFVRCKAP